MTRHRAAFSLVTPAQPTPGTLPDGHLDRINALQAVRGKSALKETDLIARPIRLFGNQLTSYFTRVPDADLRALADQINTSGGPMLSAHVTDTTPIGTYYAAEITPGELNPSPEPGQPGQVLYLDTWAYWLNDDTGQGLVRQIDAGIINEASIGYWYEELICSITGSSYWNSPYWAGETYQITDPDAGTTSTRLCFLWTTGNVEFAEGSLVYRGAYPGTRVGGITDTATTAQFSPAAPTGPTPTTRFQLAASQDMADAFKKPRDQQNAGNPTPTPPAPAAPTPHQEDPMEKLTLKLADGSARTVTSAEAQTLLTDQITLALSTGQATGQQAERERIAASLNVEPAKLEDPRALETLASEAGDGREYRADLLNELQALTVTLSGEGQNAEAHGQRARRAYGALSITDVREEVARLRAQRDALIPNSQLSDTPDEPATPTPKVPLDYDHA